MLYYGVMMKIKIAFADLIKVKGLLMCFIAREKQY